MTPPPEKGSPLFIVEVLYQRLSARGLDGGTTADGVKSIASFCRLPYIDSMDYSVKSDNELLLTFRSGDVRAFDEIFNRHWRALFVLASRMLEDEQRAEDALQEAFVSLYENAGQREISHVKSYLYQVVRYQCFMQLRAGKISAKHLRRLRMVYSINDVEEYIFATELEHTLNHRIEELPEKCREIFYLSRYELLSNKKIAEQLNISQKTVEHQLTKALKKLRLTVDKMVVLAFLSGFLKNIF